MNELATRDDSSVTGIDEITIEPMTRDQAIEFVRAVKVADTHQFWRLITGFVRRVWESLDYPDWDTFYENEIGELHFKLSRTMRREAVAALANPREVLGIDSPGYSNSQIARLIGVTEGTVRGDIKELRKKIEIPSERVGLDGRSRRDPIRQISAAVIGGDVEPEAEAPEPESESGTGITITLPATEEEAIEALHAIDEIMEPDEGEPEPEASDEGEPEPEASDEGEPEPEASDEGEPEPEASDEGEPDVGTVQRHYKSTADHAVELVGPIHKLTDKLDTLLNRKSVDWNEIGTPDYPDSGDTSFYLALVELEAAARTIMNAVDNAHEKATNTIDVEVESED